MKKIYVLLWIVFGGLMLLSCFKDKGNYDYSPINRFEVTMTPEVTSDNQIYYVVKPSTGDDSVTFSVSITDDWCNASVSTRTPVISISANTLTRGISIE